VDSAWSNPVSRIGSVANVRPWAWFACKNGRSSCSRSRRRGKRRGGRGEGTGRGRRRGRGGGRAVSFDALDHRSRASDGAT